MNIEVCEKCKGCCVDDSFAFHIYESCAGTFWIKEKRPGAKHDDDLKRCLVFVRVKKNVLHSTIYRLKGKVLFDSVFLDDHDCPHFVEHFVYDANFENGAST